MENELIKICSHNMNIVFSPLDQRHNAMVDRVISGIEYIFWTMRVYFYSTSNERALNSLVILLKISKKTSMAQNA